MVKAYLDLLQLVEDKEKVIETQNKLIGKLLTEKLETCNYCLSYDKGYHVKI